MAYKGYTISDLLDLTVQESLQVLNGLPKIAEAITLLCEVGLGYLQWGQSVRTLSGGEGQRIKLAKELGGKSSNHTLYLLDEPTTGLHPADVKRLLVLLNKLVDAGNTVIVVEHNVDVIRESDWVVDIGPEGGDSKWLVGLRVLCDGNQYVHEIPKAAAALKERLSEIKGIIDPKQLIGAFVVGDCPDEEDRYWIGVE